MEHFLFSLSGTIKSGGIEFGGRDEHPSKADFLISFIEEGRSTCDNNEQFLKTPFSIEVTEEGISNLISVNEKHPMKVSFPIAANEEGKEI